MLKNAELSEKIKQTSKCFRTGCDAEGLVLLGEIIDTFIKELETNKKELPQDLMNKLVEIQGEMDNRNYIRIADILEFKILDKIT